MSKTPRIPTYRKHKASGRGVVTLNGHDIYLPGKYGSADSRAAYQRTIAEWTAGKCQPRVAANDLTVTELCLRHHEHAADYYSPSELYCINAAVKPFRATYGPTLVKDLGPLRMQAYRQGLIDQGLARTTINGHVLRIRRMVRWGVANEIVDASTLAALVAVRCLAPGRSAAKETEPVTAVADAVVDATIQHLSPVLAAMVNVQRLTGMRSGELCRMRMCDITTTPSGVWKYVPATHKTSWRGDKKTIMLGPRAQEIIRPFLKRDTTAYLFSPIESEAWRRERLHSARKTAMCCGNTPGSNRKAKPKRQPRDQYDSASYGRAIANACELAFPAPAELTDDQLKQWRADHKWNPHMQRHAAATRIGDQFGIEHAGAMLGHKKVDMTEHYAKLNDLRAAKVAAAAG